MHSNHDQAFMDHVVVKKTRSNMERGIWMDYQDFEYSILCQKKLDLHFDDHKIFFSRDEKSR